jgi:hypothetical protein
LATAPLLLCLVCLVGLVACDSCTKSGATLERDSWDELVAELPRLDKREQLSRLEAWLKEHPPSKKWTFGSHQRRPQYQALIRIRALRHQLFGPDAATSR